MQLEGATRVRLVDREVDLVRRVVTRDGVELAVLQPRELSLLTFLLAHAVRPVSRRELLAEVWGYRGSAKTRVVDMTMRRLREKLEVDAGDPRVLLTVRGVGYRLEADELELVAGEVSGEEAGWIDAARAQLAVFAGSVPSSAIAEVVDVEGPAPWQVVSELVAAGVMVEEAARYRLRDRSGWERLGIEERRAVEARHAAWALRLRGAAARGSLQDVRAAMERALESGDLEAAEEGARALQSTGHTSALTKLLESEVAGIRDSLVRATALAEEALASATGEQMARALHALAWRRGLGGQLDEAVALLLRAEPLAEGALLARVRTALAICHFEQGRRRRGRIVLEAARSAARAAGDPPRVVADVAMTVGLGALADGDGAAAAEAFEEADRIYEELGEARGRGWALNNLGEAARMQGRVGEARRFYRRGAEWFRVAEDPNGWVCEANLAYLEVRERVGGDLHARLVGLMATAAADGRRARAALVGVMLAVVELRRGDVDAAVRVLEDARGALAETGFAERGVAELAEEAIGESEGALQDAFRALAIDQWRALKEPARAVRLMR